MVDLVLTFKRCELHVGKREVRIDGRLHAVEPLAFDVLVYLLRHRDRVVPKDELLDHIWLGKVVSVGSLARAVMMARRAIDDSDESPLIRTVHRVGYHFVGEVHEQAAGPSEAPAPAAVTPIAVALLPFENLTGEPSLDWTTVGLMALVGNALAIEPRLAPLSMDAVFATLRSLPSAAPIEQRAVALQRRDGAGQVVHTRILRDAHGYRLDYRLLSGPHGHAGSLHADNPIRLGRALARRLIDHLWQEEPGIADSFAAQDPWAMEVFARAVHAWTEQSWQRAASLLRVVLDIEPEYGEARRLLQRIDAM